MHLGPWQTTIIAVAPQPALPAQASPRTNTYARYYLRSMHQASSLEEKQDKEEHLDSGDPPHGPPEAEASQRPAAVSDLASLPHLAPSLT